MVFKRVETMTLWGLGPLSPANRPTDLAKRTNIAVLAMLSSESRNSNQP